MHKANIHKATRLASQDQLAIFFLFRIFLLFLPISSFFLLFHSFFSSFYLPVLLFIFAPGPLGPTVHLPGRLLGALGAPGLRPAYPTLAAALYLQ